MEIPGQLWCKHAKINFRRNIMICKWVNFPQQFQQTHSIIQNNRNIHDNFDCNNELPYHFRVLIGNFLTNCANGSHLFLTIRYIMFCLATTPLTEIDLASTSLKTDFISKVQDYVNASALNRTGKKNPLASTITDTLIKLIEVTTSLSKI